MPHSKQNILECFLTWDYVIKNKHQWNNFWRLLWSTNKLRIIEAFTQLLPQTRFCSKPENSSVSCWNGLLDYKLYVDLKAACYNIEFDASRCVYTAATLWVRRKFMRSSGSRVSVNVKPESHSHVAATFWEWQLIQSVPGHKLTGSEGANVQHQRNNAPAQCIASIFHY